jgi:hypothetical protein
VINLPFDKPGRFYKGNLHTHSTRSDGVLEPEEVITRYQSRGYDFIALTDHFLPKEHFDDGSNGFIHVTDTRNYRTPDFSTLLGAELHAPGIRGEEMWHLVAVGLPLDFAAWTPEERVRSLAERAAASGAFVGLAHPAWYALPLDDAEEVIPSAHAIEIYNEGCSLVDRCESWHFADALLANGVRLNAFASEDAHFKDPRGVERDAFGGWVQVKSASLDPGDLLAALKAGAYYSSTGPEIHDIILDGDNLVVRMSPAVHVLVTGRGASFAWEVGECVEEARFPLEKWANGGYCRVTVIDANNRRAWSNPIWFDD